MGGRSPASRAVFSRFSAMPSRRAFAWAAVPATTLARLKAVSGGWPSCSATMAAQRVSTGARFTRMGDVDGIAAS